MPSFLIKLFFILFTCFLSFSVKAEDMIGANIKFSAIQTFSDVSFLDGTITLFEVETFADSGRWSLYGFSDIKFVDNNLTDATFDFYKYIVKFDLLGNDRLFLVAEAKETFSFSSDLFTGVGTSFNIPFIGTVMVNALYFLADKNTVSNSSVDLPFLVQASWFNFLGPISDTPFSWYHAGWSDIDMFFENEKAATHVSFQAYEGVGINYKDYAVEVGYKYWHNVSGGKDNAHSILTHFIKRF